MKKVIVTGANGFIGSALCKELLENGIEVIAVVRNEASKIECLTKNNNFRILYCDLMNYDRLLEHVTERDIDVFYHFAWSGSSGDKRGDYEIQIANIQSACNAMEVGSKLNCKRFVFDSSIMNFEVEALMKTELVPPISTLYSSAKLASDYMLKALSGFYGIEYISALISNVYGPGENSSRLISSSLKKMLKGHTCEFTHGNQMYDFIYIQDAVRCLKLIGEKGKSNKMYYVGSTNPRPLKEFLLEMKDEVDANLEIGLGKIPYSGISLTYNEFDIHEVENDIGFKSTISFKEGIKLTIDWMRREKIADL